MTKEEKKEFDVLKEQVQKLSDDIKEHQKERRKLIRRKKALLKKIDELEKKYEHSNTNL